MNGMNDKDAIQDVLHRYALHMSNFDFEKAIELYSDDAIFDETSVSPDFYLDGKDALYNFWVKHKSNVVQMMHMYTNFILEKISDTEADTVTTLFMQGKTANGDLFNLKGFWEDKFKKIDGKWKFSYRKLTLFPDFSES